jgi:tetratricopeptide (TPR) repeat protein
MHVGLLDEALREIREAMRLNPGNTLAHLREGVIFLYQGQYAAARDVFQRTPATFSPELRTFQLADALFQLGQKDEARREAAAYLRADPADVGGLNTSLQAMFAADQGNVARMLELVKSAEELAMGSDLVKRDRAARDALREVLDLDELHDERVLFETVDVGDVGMVERGEDFGFALEPSQPLAIVHLDRDLALQLRIARAIHLAHSPRAEGGDDFGDANSRAWSQRHLRHGW